MKKNSKKPAPGKAAASGEMKGAEITIRCLEKQGVEVMFAYPGGASMELHQALRQSSIRVILPRHEQGGAFAAGGYARATGKVGVCMATSGPGATNLISGITDAYLDSIPTVFITGQVHQSLIGKNAFQETDIIGITRPIVKHSYLVLNAKDIPQVFAEAFYLAASGRPGPVVIDLPKDVQQSRCIPDFKADPKPRTYKVPGGLNPADVQRVRAAIAACERPCLYAGGGIITAGAQDELRRVAEAYNIPVVTTLMGIGAIPETHPLSMKWLGMHGTFYANYAANESDLLIAVGSRFDDRVTGKVAGFAPKAKIVHVDIDPSEINKNKPADIGIVADAREFLRALLVKPVRQEYAAWHRQLREVKKKHPLGYRKAEDEILPQFVIERLHHHTKGRALMVTGVGQHQMWTAQFYTFSRARQLITSGGLGAMGFGLPAAMGAKVACPEATVIDVDGDGSFQMNIQELGTLHCEEIGVKMVVLNNQHLGMVAQWEDTFYGRNRGNTVLASGRVAHPYPNFVDIAKGYLIPGRHVWKRGELDAAIREMLSTDGPFLLDVHTQYQEHVLPMIPPGANYKDTIM